MPKTRVYEIAQELNKTNKEVIEFLKEKKVEVKSHMSTLEEKDEKMVRKSGYSFRRLVKDLLYDITSPSALPLLLVRDFGICSFLVSVGLGIFFLIRYFLYGVSVEGWTSLMLVLLAFFGITLLSIGIMGIYLMNILNESKKMPHYVIRRKDV